MNVKKAYGIKSINYFKLLVFIYYSVLSITKVYKNKINYNEMAMAYITINAYLVHKLLSVGLNIYILRLSFFCESKKEIILRDNRLKNCETW